MNITVNQMTVAARLRTVALAPTKDPRAVHSVMAEMMPHFQSWAPKLVRSFATTAAADADDAVSVCAIHTFETITAQNEDTVGDWYAYIYGGCKYKILAHFESPAVTIAGGMTSLMRERRRAINDDHRETHDPAVGYELDERDCPTIDSDSAFVISEVEGRELAQMIIEACYERSETLGDAAAEWIGGAYAEPPMIATGSEIGRTLGVGAKKGCALMVQLRAIAKAVCEDEFGIDSPF